MNQIRLLFNNQVCEIMVTYEAKKKLITVIVRI